MSGGVDSAVTLLKAGPAAVGVTLRLWLDPNGPDAERACCSPSAVIAARESCHARGLPHVTLDLREAFRRAVVTPFVRGYARGETPNPCIRCNGGFRFAELLSFARRVGAAALATGHYARIVERDGRLLLARGVDEHKDQSYMLARLGAPAPVADPLPARRADQGGDARRGGRGRARGGAPRGEPGGVLPRRRRLPLVPRPPGAARRRRARSSTRRASSSASTTATGSSRRVSGAVSASRPPSRSTRSRPTPARTRSWSGRAPSLARTRVSARGQLYAPVSRVTAKLRYRSPAVPATVEATATGFRLQLDEPAYGVARGQAAVLYDGDVVVGSGLVTSAAAG